MGEYLHSTFFEETKMTQFHDEKFKLIHEIQRTLREAPPKARMAWKGGWNDVSFYPNGDCTINSCGCCGTDYPPGWYGYDQNGVWKFICDPKGGDAYKTYSWTCLD